MAHTKLTWADALADAGCYGFLEPVASQALDVALELCPGARLLLGNGACEDLRGICQARLGIIYERPLIKLAIGRLGFADKLSIDVGGEAGADAMRHIAEAVRDEVAADAGASLRARLPFAEGYERTVADNYSKALAECFDRLLIRRDDVSRDLLGGHSITSCFERTGGDFARLFQDDGPVGLICGTYEWTGVADGRWRFAEQAVFATKKLDLSDPKLRQPIMFSLPNCSKAKWTDARPQPAKIYLLQGALVRE